jgi:VIT1/CCC1 family predicted Fe2+/Mn2+ transporter
MSGDVTAHLSGHEHPDVTGGWLRPAVFGAMDGLVSNVALIAGVAGGTRSATEPTAVVLAGLAGLAAGAFSMAAGEYTSVASQTESARREIALERREIVAHPDAEMAELAEAYVEKGLEQTLAREVAQQIHRDVERAVAVHAQEEFGVDVHELPSATLAAGSSFVAFALGALVPLLPYLLGARTLLPALALTLAALFGCGALVTRLTVRPWWYGGTRQLLLGALAAAATYGFGALVDTSGLA